MKVCCCYQVHQEAHAVTSTNLGLFSQLSCLLNLLPTQLGKSFIFLERFGASTYLPSCRGGNLAG